MTTPLGIYEAVDNYIQDDKFPGWSSPTKCKLLIGCILETATEISVDLGAYAGRASICMGFAHRAQGFGVCHGIDAWDNAVALESMKDDTNKAWWAKLNMGEIKAFFLNQIELHNLGRFVAARQMTASDAVKLFVDGSIGVLHFDANHSEEVSVRDIQEWMPKVKAGGYLCFDDTDWNEGGVNTTAKAQQILLDAGWVCTHTQPKEEGKCGEWKMFQKPVPTTMPKITREGETSTETVTDAAPVTESIEIPFPRPTSIGKPIYGADGGVLGSPQEDVVLQERAAKQAGLEISMLLSQRMMEGSVHWDKEELATIVQRSLHGVKMPTPIPGVPIEPTKKDVDDHAAMLGQKLIEVIRTETNFLKPYEVLGVVRLVEAQVLAIAQNPNPQNQEAN